SLAERIGGSADRALRRHHPYSAALVVQSPVTGAVRCSSRRISLTTPSNCDRQCGSDMPKHSAILRLSRTEYRGRSAAVWYAQLSTGSILTQVCSYFCGSDAMMDRAKPYQVVEPAALR